MTQGLTEAQTAGPAVGQVEVAVMAVQSQALGGLFDPDAEGSLTQAERSLISGLLANNAQIEAAIPDDISSDDLWQTLEVCSKVGARVEKVRTVLKMLVGRALVVMENRPEIYKARGFLTLASFMGSSADNALPAITGISRAGLYEARGMATDNPDMAISEMIDIGVSKLKLIGAIRKGGDSDYQKWVDLAKTGTAANLREAIYRSNNQIPEGSLERDVLTLEMTRAEKEIIQEFLRDADFQAYCKDSRPGPMLVKVIAEASTEWAVQIREQQESKRG